ncbi:hypothetical protein TcG_09051 [Trypanosoma cruzi]|nr:hypothetical protein TcG_09051 [Trypanosoma cruzi]
MQYERQCHGTLLPCTPQIFSISHASCTLFCCVCGYHDAPLLRQRILLQILCFCQGLCAHVLLQSVCGDGGATRVRGPWRAVCVDEPSVRTKLLLLALTNTVLRGWHSLSVVVVVLVHVVCITHRVDVFLLVGASHFCV